MLGRGGLRPPFPKILDPPLTAVADEPWRRAASWASCCTYVDAQCDKLAKVVNRMSAVSWTVNITTVKTTMVAS